MTFRFRNSKFGTCQLWGIGIKIYIELEFGSNLNLVTILLINLIMRLVVWVI